MKRYALFCGLLITVNVSAMLTSIVRQTGNPRFAQAMRLSSSAKVPGMSVQELKDKEFELEKRIEWEYGVVATAQRKIRGYHQEICLKLGGATASIGGIELVREYFYAGNGFFDAGPMPVLGMLAFACTAFSCSLSAHDTWCESGEARSSRQFYRSQIPLRKTELAEIRKRLSEQNKRDADSRASGCSESRMQN